MYNKILIFLSSKDKYTDDKVYIGNRAEKCRHKVIWYFKNMALIMPSIFKFDIENDIYRDYELVVSDYYQDKRMMILLKSKDENDKTYTKSQIITYVNPASKKVPYYINIDFDFQQISNVTKIEKDFVILYYPYGDMARRIRIPKEFVYSLPIGVYVYDRTIGFHEEYDDIDDDDIRLGIVLDIEKLDDELDITDAKRVIDANSLDMCKENYIKYYLSRI